jgi:hypothetical protein
VRDLADLHDGEEMTDRSYETVREFGVLYDAVPAYATRKDTAFYVEEAARRGSGGVLELGSGTGRILLPSRAVDKP